MSNAATVMFVDDEAHIVQILKLTFADQYRVLTASSGPEALQILSSEGPVHVVVSDQRMPGMLGIELLANVARISPGTMRILLTGYSDLASMVGSINDGEVFRFINKPWDNTSLRATIREAVEIAFATGTSAALTADQPVPAAAGDASNRGLLVLGEPPTTTAWFRDHFRRDILVYGAKTVEEAVDILEREEIGVVATDTHVAGRSTLDFLRLLKREHPAVTTVMLSASADVEEVRQMINEIQVCRVVFRPLRKGSMDLAVRAAMKQHERFLADPRLMRRQTVMQSPVSGTESGHAGLFARLREIGSRWRSRRQ